MTRRLARRGAVPLVIAGDVKIVRSDFGMIMRDTVIL
ncbi:hypothetical protein SAMN06265355_102516 [Actinomadura mexicana]|uniref:Uncharacterized protein n=1 Tax=Actinomadura mexicana TaxID=134959 RepID=A0A238VZ53_9ACTN|nr:hypothetical protein SAMN06265355_102516 [Actinomadura mexicana]